VLIAVVVHHARAALYLSGYKPSLSGYTAE
jgi:hypothetical protein